MQPLRLELQAFGPFCQRQEIDFETLGKVGLYLITGPTGAGKSTLLDGLCFALYGESSGAERSPEDLRSDHAEDDLATQAVLDFQTGTEVFRVARSPSYQRQKLRGEGTTTQAQTATLHRLVIEDGQRVEGECLAAKPRDVDRQIAERLGFSARQFRQVMLLPQGRFRELLTIDTREREEVLKQLFDTTIHEQIQQRLKVEADDLGRAFRLDRVRRQTILDQVEVETEDALRTRINETRDRLVELTADESRLEGLEATARKQLDAATHANQQLDERQAKQSELDALVQATAAINEHRASLALIDAADGLADLAKGEADAAAQTERQRAALDGATAAQADAEKAAGKAAEALAASEAAAPEREAIANRLRDLERAVDRVQALEKAMTDRDARQVEHVRLLGLQEQTRRDGDRRAEELAAAQAELTRLASVAGGLELARIQARDATVQLERFRSNERLAHELLRLEKQLADARLERTNAETRHAQAAQELKRVQTAFMNSQAPVLAATLQAGHPCPVCGALDHPDPATGDGASVSREDLDAAAAALEAQTAEVRSLDAALADLERQKGQLEVQVTQPEKSANETDLQASCDQTEKSLAAAEAATRQVPILEAKITTLTEAQQKHAATLATLVEQTDAAKLALADAEATVREKGHDVPAGLRTGVEIASAVDAARGELAAARSAHDACASAKSDADLRLATAREARAGAETALREAHETHKGLQATLVARSETAGFSSLEALRNGLARRDEAPALREAIEAHEQAMTSVQAVLKQLDAALSDVVRQELAPLEATLGAATAQRKAAADARVASERQLAQDEKTQRQLGEIADELARVEARHAVMAKLSQVANDREMTFQRHVLAVQLDWVLLLASEHLAQMTRGRYRLFRDLELRDGRAHGGLDLLVDDSYTGERRSVKTLSGGEGFLAALALALGLSETVASMTGGIRIDALFIDEGFGSLDAEALDVALDTLLELRATGRAVGIISHVSELRQRIDARIDVIPDASGSRARVVVP